MADQELYSYHVFLFPFQWQYTGKEYAKRTFEDKTSLKEFMAELKDTSWKRSLLPDDSVLYYNERNYFFDFVRDILYDDMRDHENQPRFVAHYQYDIEPEAIEYKIELAYWDNTTKTYVLQVDSILLHLYNTGVGVISFHLNNRLESQSDPNSILDINQFGRRLYPPFFNMDREKIGSKDQYQYNNFEAGLHGVSRIELSNSISLGSIKEDWQHYKNPDYFKNNPFQLPAFISALFPTLNLTTNPLAKDEDAFAIFITPALDDRMFVVCWYGNDEIANKLKVDTTGDYDFKAVKIDNEYAYLREEWLYKYLFVDKSLTCQNEDMLKEKLKEHYNTRWINYSSFFGATRYSFVVFTNSLRGLKQAKTAFLLNHTQTMYYKMVELCLVQRACILRFADEVTEISAMMKTHEKLLGEHVSSLYKQYIRFVNKIYFREITAQDQGIELYDLLQKHMRLDRDVRDLDNEIEELHRYIVMMEERRRNRNLEILTTLAGAFVIPSFIAGFFGMNNLALNETKSLIHLPIILGMMGVAPLLFWLVVRSNKLVNTWKIIGVIAITVLMIVCIYFLTQNS